MAISIVASSSNSGTASPLTLTAPTGCQAGDVLIAWMLARGTSSSITTPAGWTLIGSPIKVGSLMFGLYYRVFQVGDTTWNWTMVGGRYSGAIIAWRGVDNVTPIAAFNYGTGTGGTNVTVTTITAGSGNTIDFRAGSYYASNHTYSAETLNSVGMTGQYDMGNTYCSNAGSYLQNITGATGSASATCSGSQTEWAGGLVALSPAAAGGSLFRRGFSSRSGSRM